MKDRASRRPRGIKVALRNGARNKATHPNSWSDITPVRYIMVRNYIMRLFGIRFWGEELKKHPDVGFVRRKVKAKYPTYKDHEITSLYRQIIDAVD